MTEVRVVLWGLFFGLLEFALCYGVGGTVRRSCVAAVAVAVFVMLIRAIAFGIYALVHNETEGA